MEQTATTRDLYAEYLKTMHRIADLRYSGAVLQWDQETYLPPKGARFRGQQIATLSELAHHYFTESSFGDLLQRLNEKKDLSPAEKRNLELTLEDYSKQKKFSSEFVRRLTEAINKSFFSWINARRENNFQIFAAELEPLVELKKQEADFLGYSGHIYNALLNEFDKGSNVEKLDSVFNSIRIPLKELFDKIASSTQVDDSILKQHFPKDAQWAFGMLLLREMGYDFESGRQDLSEHPFTTSFNSSDVRITTRIDEKDLGNMTWSCIHELGHAFYEQGLPESQYGLPLGEACSLSIHESQSRLWENHVGRSEAFCAIYLPKLQQYFPDQLKDVGVQDFYKAINKVQPGFIRTESDELTYHFHVMIRYELEKKLIGGELTTAEIPAYWNEQYEKYLNVKVPNDREGCLQDVHWSHGSFGYFPTYSLGSFYAAQFFDLWLNSDPQNQKALESGNSSGLLGWLRENIHRHGRMYETEELSKKLCGEGLNVQYFLKYLEEKYRKIYQF